LIGRVGISFKAKEEALSETNPSGLGVGLIQALKLIFGVCITSRKD